MIDSNVQPTFSTLPEEPIKKKMGRPFANKEKILEHIAEANKKTIIPEKEKMIKVRFHHSELTDTKWSILYNLKPYSFMDEEEYTLPKSMVDDINASCKIPNRSKIHKFTDGTPKKTGKSKVNAYFEIIG